jgi:hypothetical protein
MTTAVRRAGESAASVNSPSIAACIAAIETAADELAATLEHARSLAMQAADEA